MGISPLRKEENAVPMKVEKRIPAGINCAKTTIIPKVRKNQTPNNPIPLIPPAKAIPKENRAIATTRAKLRMMKIFFILSDMVFVSFTKTPYLFLPVHPVRKPGHL
jgi:hypothetical protein